MNLFARKSIDELRADAFTEGEHSMKRALTAVNLVSLGVGAIIGTGIFVLIGHAAAAYAGPGIVISIIIAGLGCAFAGLCYAEFAAMIPIAGSAYTYGYATLGELIAWIIGWDLILEYLFGAATVAVGWSGWLASLLRDFGIPIPPQWYNAPGTHLVLNPETKAWQQVTPELTESLGKTGVDIASLPHALGVFNLVAAVAIALVTVLLVVGIKESASFNNVAVFIKVAVVFTFIGCGLWYLFGHPDLVHKNWSPFIPPNEGGEFGKYGWSGVLRAAGVIFFAYIGFDAVSTTAQEAKNPQRDMPIGILGSLAICTVLYILVSGILTALVPYSQLNVAEPVAVGIEVMGLHFLATLVKIGVIAGLSSVMLVMLMSQPRIFYSMARDGLLPATFGKLHPRFRTPYISTILTGAICAIVAGTVPLALLGELVSIGTLLAFVIVCAGVWYLRVKEPNRERPFKTPLVPVVPILGILICFAMMAGLPGDTWLRLIVWLVIGLVIYFMYSRKHSVLQRTGHTIGNQADEPSRPTYTDDADS
ncbi:MAG TPA: amino acid permease [Longimicrobiaceae bacterium]|nr:amino acid permease [Longimicrobiaceae bacterium]